MRYAEAHSSTCGYCGCGFPGGGPILYAAMALAGWRAGGLYSQGVYRSAG